MKRILLIICFFVYILSYGQGLNDIQSPQIIPPSPQAAAFAKYVETPVSHFNGTTGISIPIYNIKQKEINVPIQLSYNSGGIKVSEEASWVGLGWSLQAGGQITHIIKGADDDSNTPNFRNRVFPFPVYNNNPYTYNNTNVNTMSQAWDAQGNGYDITNDFLYERRWDTEMDLYMYNFGGYSGKFVKDGNTFYDLAKNDIVFERIGSKGIKATTPDGLIYTFDDETIEHSLNNHPVVFVGGNSQSPPSTSPITSISTYYLTSIQSPLDPENEVTFEYKSFKELKDADSHTFPYLSNYNTYFAPQLPVYDEQYTTTNNPLATSGQTTKAYTKPFNEVLYLDKINFSNGYIQFDKNFRGDAYAYKLDRVKVYSDYQSEPIKNFKFNYNYFSGDADKGGDYILDIPNSSDSYYPISFRALRLKLLNIADETDLNEFKKHEFTYYNQEALPFKTSYAQDYWGYYNGKNGNTSLIPDYRRYLLIADVPNSLQSWYGANREPSESHAKMGMLKKIKYPTKGTSEFFYNMHTYDNLKYTSGGHDDFFESTHEGIMDFNEEGPGYKELNFKIEKVGTTVPPVDFFIYLKCATDDLCDIMGNVCGDGIEYTGGSNNLYATLFKIEPASSGGGGVRFVNHTWTNYNPEIRDCLDGSPRTHEYTAKNLEPGNYKLRVNYPDNLEGYRGLRSAIASVRYFKRISAEESNQIDLGIGGGLRISRIITSPGSNSPNIVKNYKYENGVMTRFPLFYYYTHKVISYNAGGGASQTSVLSTYSSHLHSNPVVPYSFSANGSLVGYEKVTESITSAGRTEYIFNVKPDRLNFTLDPITNTTAPIAGNPYLFVSLFPFAETYLPGVPSTAYFLNGKVKSIAHYSDNRDWEYPDKQTFYTYNVLERGALWNLKVSDRSAGPNMLHHLFHASFYPLTMGKIVPVMTKVHNYEPKSVNNPTGYIPIETLSLLQYNSSNHLFPSAETNSTSISNNEKKITNYTYLEDLASPSNAEQELITQNKIIHPVKSESFVQKDNGSTKHLFSQKTRHKDWGNNSDNSAKIILPEFVQAYKGIQTSTNTFEDRLVYHSYYGNGNIREVSMKEGVHTVYIWGYKEQFPIAKIENATYSQVSSEVSNLQNLSNADNDRTLAYTGKEGDLREALDELRNNLPNSMVTTYTYDPLIGITSMTDPKGYVVYYEYDEYNRLKSVKDKDGNLLSKNEYNYAN